MLELQELRIKNLASISSDIYYFKSNLDVIVGMNLDTSPIEIRDYSLEQLKCLNNLNISSNGSGKSMIIEALNLCLFGVPIRPKILTRDLVRKGEEEAEIELICKNDFLDLPKIRIIRKIFTNKNKSTLTKIFETKNGEEIEVVKSSSTEIDKYILEHYISLSKEDIINFFLIQKDRYVPFLLLPDNKKKEILSKFTGISDYFFVEAKLEDNISSYEKDNIDLDKDISKIEGKKEIYSKNLEEIPSQEDFEKENKQEIINLENLKKKEEEKIFSKEKEKKDIYEDIKYFENLLNHWKEREEKFQKIKKDRENHPLEKKRKDLSNQLNKKEKFLEEIEESYKEAKSILDSENQNYENINSLVKKLKSLLKNLIQCPNCKYEFNPSDNKSKQEIEKDLDENNKSLKDKNKVIEDLNKDIEGLEKLKKKTEKEIESLKEKISFNKNSIRKALSWEFFIKDCISTYKSKISNLKSDESTLNSDISSFKDKIKKYDSQIKELKEEKYNILIQEKKNIEKNIKDCELEIESKEKDKNENLKQIQLNKDSKICFNNFKNYLFNKMLFNIENLVNNYLSKFSDFIIEIRGSKVLADGKSQRDEINCIIKRDGKEINYFTLSSGEKAGIDIAFILTFQNILNTSSENGLNFLCLDEITGIDAYNQDKILNPLIQINKPIIYISHVSISPEIKATYLIKKNNTTKINN